MRTVDGLKCTLVVSTGFKNCSRTVRSVAISDQHSSEKGNQLWRLSQGTEYSGLIAVADPIREESQDDSSKAKRNWHSSYSHADWRP